VTESGDGVTIRIPLMRIYAVAEITLE